MRCKMPLYLLVDNAVQIVRSGASQDAKDVVQLQIGHSLAE